MLTEFVESLRRTNALALALAVVMGSAVGKLVSAVVNDLLMPVVGLVLGGGDWRAWQIPLRTAPDGTARAALGVGHALGTLVDFVLIAFFVFLIARALLQPAPAPPGPPMKDCAACGESILARATRCRYCTSLA